MNFFLHSLVDGFSFMFVSAVRSDFISIRFSIWFFFFLHFLRLISVIAFIVVSAWAALTTCPAETSNIMCDGRECEKKHQFIADIDRIWNIYKPKQIRNSPPTWNDLIFATISTKQVWLFSMSFFSCLLQFGSRSLATIWILFENWLFTFSFFGNVFS